MLTNIILSRYFYGGCLLIKMRNNDLSNIFSDGISSISYYLNGNYIYPPLFGISAYRLANNLLSCDYFNVEVIYMNKLIVSSVLLLVLDLIWLKGYMGNEYKKMIRKIQGSDMRVNTIYAILSYTLMIIGLNVFVIPNINKDNLLFDSLKYGFLFGIILYGVYDFTIGAVLKDWNLNLAIVDVLWGGIVYFLATYLTFKILEHF